ncbi:interleukin-15 receptor subunit alpha isoform X2 [Haemorhous mexicanus]|uniref:interleukin-15 receptor subunit alpha isoform X2 n=1 Tax=Haemorhous mexicanus TaxID=30427 RepID=UPI0028BD8562|nr:interleukin-15 receptor subunit alpha isoform X2 [Haemorhous mexicanus]
MALPLLPLLCGTAALLLLRAAADTVHCSPPKAVANAHIDAGNRTELNSRLRYSCKPGYKRKAGTSSLIQCILWNGSEPRWTDPTLQCIRDPALSRETPGPASTTQRGTTGASPNSSPSPASSQSPVPPAPDGLSPDGSRPPEMVPTPDTSTPGEGTTPLPIPPTDYAAGSIQSVASSVGKLGKKKLLWETGAYFNFFKLKIPFGDCGSFLPWPTGMPLSGGRIQHPNFFLARRIPNSLPPGKGRDLVMVPGVVLAPYGATLVQFISHGLGDAPHPECPSHRTPGAAGHRNCGRLLLEEEEEMHQEGLHGDREGHSHGGNSL